MCCGISNSIWLRCHLRASFWKGFLDAKKDDAKIKEQFLQELPQTLQRVDKLAWIFAKDAGRIWKSESTEMAHDERSLMIREQNDCKRLDGLVVV